MSKLNIFTLGIITGAFVYMGTVVVLLKIWWQSYYKEEENE